MHYRIRCSSLYYPHAVAAVHSTGKQVVQFVSEQQGAMAAKADRSTVGTVDDGRPPSGGLFRNGGYLKVPSSAELVTQKSEQVVTLPEGVLTTAWQREGSQVAKAGAALGHDSEVVVTLSAGDGAAVGNGSCCPIPHARSHSINSGPGHTRGRSHSHGDAGSAGVKDTAEVDGDNASGSGRALIRSASGGGDCHSSGVVVLLGGGRRLSFATAVLLAAALCIHSILEGMALGAQSSMRSTEDIMVAIAAHKGLAAYALGASIVESGASSDRLVWRMGQRGGLPGRT